MFKWVVLSCVVFFFGCVPLHDDSKVLSLVGSPLMLKVEKERGFLVTASFDGAFFDDVVKMLPENVSVCVDESVRFARFSLDVVDVDIDTFLYAACRSASCSLERYGDLYVFSSGKKADLSRGGGVIGEEGGGMGGASSGDYVIYLRFPYYKREEVVSSMSSCGCSAYYINGDRYVVKGSIGAIVRARETQKELLSTLPCEYAFDLWVVSKDYLLSADVGLSIGGTGGYSLQKMAGEVASYEWNYLVNVLSSANLERTNSDYIRHISGVFREKSSYKVTVGDSVPYVKRAITDSGSAVDTGVDYTDIGFSLDIGLEGAGVGICRLNLSFNDIGGYVQGYPIKHGSTLVDEFCISGDNKRFVGSFLVDGFTRSLIGYTRKRSEWLVYVRCLRVSAGQSVKISE